MSISGIFYKKINTKKRFAHTLSYKKSTLYKLYTKSEISTTKRIDQRSEKFLFKGYTQEKIKNYLLANGDKTVGFLFFIGRRRLK
jgi:hypothetical protein